eukprot:5800479-Prymnesium_polylepis.1
MVVLIGIGIAATTVALAVVVYLRQTQLLKAASWRFIAMSVLGGIIGNAMVPQPHLRLHTR